MRALSDSEVVEIRELYSDGAPGTELGADYGCTRQMISLIVRGYVYRDVGGPIAGERPGYRLALTNAQAKEIRERYASEPVSQRQLATEYGVSRSTIGLLLRGVTYAEAGGPLGTPEVTSRFVRGAPEGSLTAYIVREIRYLYAVGADADALAEHYDVTRMTIYRAAVGQTWKWIVDPPGSKREFTRPTLSVKQARAVLASSLAGSAIGSMDEVPFA